MFSKIFEYLRLGGTQEITPGAPPLDVGDWMIEITMVETGEKAEYRLTHLSDYLEAH